jgi:hypothetical protein
MTAQGRLRGALIALLVGVALAGAETALADGRSVLDGNDRPGPLDIRVAGHGHAGTAVTHRITTFSRWRARLLGPSTPNAFLLDISTDADPAPERIVVIFSANGRMRANVHRPNGALVGRAAASKPNARTARVSIPRIRLGNPTHYRWAALSVFSSRRVCPNRCVDQVPNATRILHDITAPAIAFPAPLVVPQSTTYSIGFTVSDAGGSGVTWRVQHRPLGQLAWTTVQSGTGPGTKTHQHVSAEGADDQYRIVARDGHGNTRISPIRLVSVPVDDANNAIQYNVPWTAGGGPSDFLQTLRSSATPGDTATYQFTGSFVGLVSRAGAEAAAGTVDVLIDNVLVGDDISPSSQATGFRRIIFNASRAQGQHTIVVSVVSGTFELDGIIAR